MKSHRASCHCGSVSLEFQALDSVQLTICNCSMCDRTGYQHVFIPHSDAKVIGEENLTLYTFGTGAAKHYFCQNCGIKPFYIPRSHPDCYSVNFRCVENDSLKISETIQFDGQNWEKNVQALRQATDDIG